METLLISFSICVLGVVGAVSLFSLAMRGGIGGEGDEARKGVGKPASGFFLATDPGGPSQSPLPSDTLQHQLESHFRLEERAATNFLEGPRTHSLHEPSSSPLWD